MATSRWIFFCENGFVEYPPSASNIFPQEAEKVLLIIDCLELKLKGSDQRSSLSNTRLFPYDALSSICLHDFAGNVCNRSRKSGTLYNSFFASSDGVW